MRALPIVAFSMCSALGHDVAETRAGLAAGRDGLSTIEHLVGEALPGPFVVGAVTRELARLPAVLVPVETRLLRLAAHLVEGLDGAPERLVRRYGATRVGVFLGTSTAGLAASEAAMAAFARAGALPMNYEFASHHAYGALLDGVRKLCGCTGPGLVVSTACSSSAKVFATAGRHIEAGIVDAAIVGGIDTLCQLTLRGFASLGALSFAPCRPFSVARDGTNIGEGGALFALDPGGDGAVVVRGVGESSDAYHMSAPHPDGRGAVSALRAALRAAGVDASEVDHVNAHGTGTRLNDLAESRAIAEVLGRDVAVVATKGLHGHLLGAAGALEAAVTALTIQDGLLPAAPRVVPRDPECDVRVIESPTRSPQRLALSCSFAFGGNNVALLLGAS